MTQSVTISSSGTSSIIDLNPTAKETTMQFTVSAGSTGATTIQVTLDDPNTAGTVTWGSLSSAINSSGVDGLGATYTLLSPISAVRLSATATSTSGGTFSGTSTLKVIQTVTG